MRVVQLKKQKSGKSIWIAVDHIVAIEDLQNEPGCRITTSAGDKSYTVAESAQQVAEALN